MRLANRAGFTRQAIIAQKQAIEALLTCPCPFILAQGLFNINTCNLIKRRQLQ